MPKQILFVTLAMNQTRFFEAVGDVLREKGWEVAHLCFHEPSWEYLRNRNVRAYNMFDARFGDGAGVRIEDFGIENINLMLSHEKAAFESRDSDRMLMKLRSYLTATQSVLREWAGSDPRQVVVVQELGGFLSNIATFYAARSLGIDNIFLEPSFFRGRVFFVRNSFAAPIVRETGGTGGADIKETVRKYLDDAVARQSIVIPSKDTHHYRKPLKKLIDAKNWRRLLEKTADKFIRGKREQFDHLGGHVLRHIRMAVNSQLLKPHYRTLPAGERFIYYPLHVPADVALTLRSPEYLDQLALIDFIARCVPHPWKLAVKEHPALVGAVDYRRVRQLLARRDNVILINPGTNNYEVIRQAGAVVTVNSKSGAEALLVGTPVVVLGDAFYRGCRLAHVVDRLRDLPDLMGRILRAPRTADSAAARAFFTDVWIQSFPGELYDATPQNVTEITASLQAYLALAPGRAP